MIFCISLASTVAAVDKSSISSANNLSISFRLGLSLLFLSAAGLTFEINLTRLFSVSQFYHFAFMIVSIALLGYGASGTFLSIFSRWSRTEPHQSLSFLSLATALSILGSYYLINKLPFDSFRIAWDARQIWILIFHYFALALPFFFSGMSVSLLLSAFPHRSGQVYATNLLGSALGCLLALFLPSYLGGEGTVVLSSGMATLAGLIAALNARSLSSQLSAIASRRLIKIHSFPVYLVSALLLIFVLVDLSLRLAGQAGIPGFELHLSPYKSLSYALQVPGSTLVYQQWNSFSRVDLVSGSGIHSFPGLSYRYLKPLPVQDGLSVDGDDLVPVMRPSDDLEFVGYFPTALAFQLRPQADTLILEPRGGLDLLVALSQGARQVTAVEMNPLIVSAAGDIYQDSRIHLEIETDRSFLSRSAEKFDVIVFSLSSSYHPVRSGAYSLAEDYRYTVESFQDALTNLNPDGIMIVTRWLQMPPSECLRTFALAVTAVEELGGNPKAQVVALRGYNTVTILVNNRDFTSGELREIREFAGERSFDLVYIPGILPEETNEYNILPESVYYQAFAYLLETQPRSSFYASYPYDVTPPTDDHPFFGHYFKWSQVDQILSEFGKTWQPFGGAGYFVIVALLLLAIMMSAILIILPSVVFIRGQTAAQPALLYLFYFGAIGFAFMLVEIPLIQRSILFLGHPAYAMTAVLFTLLLFSALGSHFSSRFSLRLVIGILVILLLAMPWLSKWIFNLALGLPLIFRLGTVMLMISPLGFLMGIPFPGGIRWMIGDVRGLPIQISRIWAANGAASVVSSVLAALLALSFGFDWVLRIGAFFYFFAWLVIWRGSGRAQLPHPRQ